jgi:MFS family permease
MTMTSLTTPDRTLRPFALVLITLIIGEATGAFEATMLTVAIPHLIEEFQVTTVDVGWAVTGFFLVAGASAAIGGRLGDLVGRKRGLIAVLILSVLGSVISVGFGTFPAIVAGRAIQGVSGAVLPLLMGLVREAVAEKRVALSIAVVAGTVSIAGAAGFFVAGILIDTVGWHAIFIASAALAIVAAIASAIFLAPSPVLFRKGDRIDWLGGILFIPALALVLFGVSSSRGAGWGSLLVWGPILAGLAVGAFWVRWELRNPAPMLNIRLLKEPKFALTMAMIAFLGLGPLGGFFLIQPVLLQYPVDAPVGLGLSATLAGTLALVLALFGYAASPFAGALAGRTGARTASIAGIAVLTVVMPLIFVFRDDLWAIIAIFFVQSIAMTFALTSIPNLVAESVPAENMSEGTGFYVVVRSIFQSASISLVALALASSVAPDTQFPDVGALGIAMALLGGATLAALVTVLFIRGKRKADPAPVPVAASLVSEGA